MAALTVSTAIVLSGVNASAFTSCGSSCEDVVSQSVVDVVDLASDMSQISTYSAADYSSTSER